MTHGDGTRVAGVSRARPARTPSVDAASVYFAESVLHIWHLGVNRVQAAHHPQLL